MSDARAHLTTLAHDLGFEVTGWTDAAPRPAEGGHAAGRIPNKDTQ